MVFDAPRLYGPRPAAGRVVERVDSQGKHLDIVFDDGIVLSTHMRMTGSWHLYRTGERWRHARGQMTVALEVPEWVAVCFNAPDVETYREFDPTRHPRFGRLGPDLCTATKEQLEECVRRLVHYRDRDQTVADVLLDQHVLCGVGNVYRSEILWACELSPFATVADLDVADWVQIVNAATRMLRSNLRHSSRVTNPDVPGGLAVYGRNGRPCARCGHTVEVRRSGDYSRLVYFCSGCQRRYEPAVRTTPAPTVREMDPHPAAAMFLANLPWRRDAAG
jgi:endonuclease-8